MSPDASPTWFEWALAQPRSAHFADAAGTRLHYAAWNADETTKPVLLFAHGFLGHSHWWDFIAPFFVEGFRVFALDFSGMGRSEARTVYAQGCFVEDLAAVLSATQAGTAPATVIGHSFGGTRLLQACLEKPQLIGHAIVLDSMVHFQGDPPLASPYVAGPRPCADQATMLSRFRLRPPQPCKPYALAHVAQHSLCPCEGGWTWCFDPLLRELRLPGLDEQALGRLGMPVDYVHAEASSVVSAERAARIGRVLGLARGPVTLPAAGHHMMLDQPISVVGVLRALLAERRLALAS
jgi:pimeloyl-ACP methyl ester carboxylesterase